MSLLPEEEESSSSSSSRLTELLPEQSPRREHRRRRSSSTSNSSSSLATTTSLPSLSPKDYLDAMLYSRGYSTQCYSTLDTAYFNQPTPLQRASYDLHLLELVRQGQVDAVRDLIQAGVSPNACNAHGESLLHMVCRRGHAALLHQILDLGGSIQISDDYGRTPLHDACWTARPNFEIVKALLQVDRHLLHLMDCRGAVPLSYVRKEHWAAWLEFFASHKDVFWPKRDLARRSSSTRTIACVLVEKEDDAPELTRLPPNSKPLQEPKSSLTPELAALVAQGRITPLEAKFLFFDQSQSESGEGLLLVDDDDDDDDDDDEDETEDDDDDDDDDDLDQSLSDLLASCWGLSLEDEQGGMASKLKMASSKSLVTTAARLAVVSPAAVLNDDGRGP